MSLTTCHIQFSPNQEQVVYLSPPLVRSLKMTGRKSVRIKLGSKSAVADIRTSKKKGRHMYIPSRLRQVLSLPRQGVNYVRNTNSRELHIGPLIGILASRESSSPMSPFGGKTSYIRKLAAAGSKRAIVYAFTPTDINWNNETVNGYFLGKNGGWVRKTVALPDVVYNRLLRRKGEQTGSILAMKERFNRKNIPFFNWSFFNKSEIYKLLESSPDSVRHIPATINNPAAEQIRELLDKHKFVYLKPVNGSQGYGIYRVTYQPGKGYYVRFHRDKKKMLYRFANFKALTKMLYRQRGSLRNYVAQQGIQLIEIDGRPIDFRFHMNKNGRNKWAVSGIGAKQAGKGSVTTHVRTGGKVMAPSQVLSHVFGGRAGEVLDKAERTAVKLAEAIDNNYPYRIGELGFDIGIDQNEDIWMFEANAMPGRHIFHHPSLRTQGKRQITHILEHCLFLSNFRIKGG